jgi:hypothetical protein
MLPLLRWPLGEDTRIQLNMVQPAQAPRETTKSYKLAGANLVKGIGRWPSEFWPIEF